MPTCYHPIAANDNRKGVFIEMQRNNCCSPNWGQANNTKTIFTPSKMFAPLLGSWLKERMRLTGFWVGAIHLVAFVFVASGASKPEIRFYIRTAACYGNDVVNFQLCQD
jgi:hypothetical protein